MGRTVINAGSYISVGAVSAAIAVGAGAFAAHGLAASLDPGALDVFQTAARYQLVHSLALCLIGIWASSQVGITRVRMNALDWAAAAMAFGIVCFCGSLYLLALAGPRWLGPVTPVGGLSFIVGWLCLAWAGTGSTRDD